MRLGKKKIATKMKIESRSKEETKTYQEWFNLVDSDGDGRISGNDTTKFFALSNLSRSQLKRLWALADVKRQGFLGFTEFVTAMQLVSLAQVGQELNSDILKTQIDKENIKPPVLEGLDALVAQMSLTINAPPEVNGAHVGPEPTTDRFLVVMSGPDQRSIPGNTIVVDAHMPFGGLATFGGSFLSKFQCSQMPHPLYHLMELKALKLVRPCIWVISSYGTESSQASPIHTPYSE
uniref:EF-hand domain-containing protein n=1 Tax=Glycine max TaxID=3847 RepID=A0A0R0IZ12_SOYBN|eukprot:XP_025985520.1 EH domain-containing protein 2 isoform X3 [Glycine max]